MLPMGYLYRKVAKRPDCLRAEHVEDIYSLHDCFTKDFADYVKFWKHNAFWVFDTPEVMESLAAEQGFSLEGLHLFYFEVFEEECDEGSGNWTAIATDPAFTTNVRVPPVRSLAGFDVASFKYGNIAESSPLSCCRGAEEIATNSHCLFETFAEARQALEQNLFSKCDPGPYRVIAVYTIP